MKNLIQRTTVYYCRYIVLLCPYHDNQLLFIIVASLILNVGNAVQSRRSERSDGQLIFPHGALGLPPACGAHPWGGAFSKACLTVRVLETIESDVLVLET
jgi:hypothetical protein